VNQRLDEVEGPARPELDRLDQLVRAAGGEPLPAAGGLLRDRSTSSVRTSDGMKRNVYADDRDCGRPHFRARLVAALGHVRNGPHCAALQT
jgi:hypothetical protein